MHICTIVDFTCIFKKDNSCSDKLTNLRVENKVEFA